MPEKACTNKKKNHVKYLNKKTIRWKNLEWKAWHLSETKNFGIQQQKHKNDKANNDETPGNFKHAWPAGIFGDSILTRFDEKRLSRNNQVVKFRDFRGATIDDLKYHLFPLLKKKPLQMILHIGTNDVVSKTSRQILNELLQLKQYIINALPTCRAIFSRPTIWNDNSKAALTLSNFNKLLGQLEEDFIDNVNIKEVNLGKKDLHLNKKR